MSFSIKKKASLARLFHLPLRYMHSVVEMADLADVEAIIELLVAFAHSVKPNDRFAVKVL
jgi:putative aminopeptidase FrvX